MKAKTPSDLELVESWWNELRGRPGLGVWRVRPGSLDGIEPDERGELIVPDLGEVRQIGYLRLRADDRAEVDLYDGNFLDYRTPYALIEAGWRLD